MSYIASIVCCITITLGALVLLMEAGYSFDLRRRGRRRVHGGRRSSDRV